MMSAVIALGEGVGTMANADLDSQLTTGLFLISMMNVALPLYQNWSKQLATDSWNYFVASLSVGPDNPWAAAGAAADYAEYTADSSAMDIDTGKVNNLIQAVKTQVKTDGDSMGQVYNVMQPMTSLERSLVQAIRTF